MQHLNLLPPEATTRSDALSLRNTVALTALALACAIGAGVLAERRLAQATERVEPLRSQLAARQAAPFTVPLDAALGHELAATRAMLLRLARAEAAIVQLGTRRQAEPSGVLDALARQGLEGLWITALSIEGAADRIELRGSALDPDLVPEYLRRLAREPAFRERPLVALDLAERTIERPRPQGQLAPDAPAKSDPLRVLDFRLQSIERGASGQPAATRSSS